MGSAWPAVDFTDNPVGRDCNRKIFHISHDWSTGNGRYCSNGISASYSPSLDSTSYSGFSNWGTGVRTALRGLDYRNQYTLAYKDISASPQDYNAYKLLAADLDSQGNYSVAATYAQRSVSIFPTPENYYNLGLALEGQGDLGRAFQAFSTGLHYGNYYPLCDSLAPLIVAYSGNQASGLQFFSSSLKLFPQDSTLWMYLAIFEATHSNNAEAKIAISQAARYGQVNQTVYDDLMTNKPFVLNIPDVGKSIRIP